jgi:hypothetical protein
VSFSPFYIIIECVSCCRSCAAAGDAGRQRLVAVQAWSSQWQRQRDRTRRKPRHETTGGEARLEPRISSRDNRHANAVAVTLLPLPPPHEPERAPKRRVPRQPTAPNYSTRRDPEFMGSSATIDTDDTNMVTLAGQDHALRLPSALASAFAAILPGFGRTPYCFCPRKGF